LARWTAAARSAIQQGATRVSFEGFASSIPADVRHVVEHTVVGPAVAKADVERVCDEAIEFGLAAVSTVPIWIQFAAKRLRNTTIRLACVVGFPTGASLPEVKAFEARRALRDGAREIDVVVNMAAVREANLELVHREIRVVVDACREVGAIAKVVMESAILRQVEKLEICSLADAAGADFVFTASGSSGLGTSASDVEMIGQAVLGKR